MVAEGKMLKFAHYTPFCAIAMVTKTRDKLIEVARQLFAHKGIENTTMNDIASASDKGRRTIYTYFKNKRDIYNAVVDRESENLVTRLREVAELQLPPMEKLEKYLNVRFELIVNTFERHDTVRSLFGRDTRRIERMRKMALAKEHKILREILDSGVAEGAFDPAQARRLVALEHMTFQGVDFSFIRDNFADIGLSRAETRRDIIDFILSAVKSR